MDSKKYVPKLEMKQNRSKKKSKTLRKKTQRRRIRGGDPSDDLKRDAIAAIPDIPSSGNKLDAYLTTVINSKNSTGKPIPTELVHNGNTYVYSYRRDMSRTYYLDVYEKSNSGLTVTIYSFNDY